MIIGIDGNEANQKIKVGSGVYAFELLKQFKKYQTDAPRVNIKYQIYLKDAPIADFPDESDNWQYKIIRPSKFWTQFGLPLILWKEKIIGKSPDVFFSLTHYAPRFCPIPSVITIFDLSFIRFPDFFIKKDLYQLKNWTEYSITQAKKIITISEFSKKEIADYYKVAADKITVAYPGYDKNKFKTQNSKLKVNEVLKKYKINMPYILYVGTVQPRKNLVRLVEAFSQLKNKDAKLKLVICGMTSEGRGGWMQEEFFQTIKKSKHEKEIVITGFVPVGDLPYLMSGAQTLVLPSLYEGFGIPVVEAMACGCPTVISDTSSLPEIAGDAAILVDPYSIDSIQNGMKEACYNESRRKELIKKGLEQTKKFNWEESTEKILEVLSDIASRVD